MKKYIFLLLIYSNIFTNNYNTSNSIYFKINIQSKINIYVNSHNINGPWFGTRKNPYKEIKDGLAATDKGITVIVQEGTYQITENLSIPDSVTVFLEPNVIIRWSSGVGMTIHGKLQALGTVTDSILFVQQPNNEKWTGLSFLNSNAGSELRFCRIEYSNGIYNKKGGAIFCSQSSPKLSHCLIQNNLADYGGAIFCENGSSPEISECTFIDNIAAIGGGAIYSENATPVLLNNYFMYNQCKGAIGGGSIVLINENNLFKIETDLQQKLYKKNNPTESKIGVNSQKALPIKNQEPISRLGGLLSIKQQNPVEQTKTNTSLNNQKILFSKYPVIEGNTFAYNSCETNGGAIVIAQNHSIIYNNNFEFNSANDGGAIYQFNADSIMMTWNIFKQNNATQNGGAFYAINCNQNDISRNLLLHNKADSGGAIFLNNTNINFLNNTLFANSATEVGTQAYSIAGLNRLTNNIFWNYDSVNVAQIGGTGANVTYCDIWNGYEGTGNINFNPQFNDTTITAFQLTLHSPCINAGDPNSPKDPDSSRADIGALYYHRIFSKIDLAPQNFDLVLRNEDRIEYITIKNLGKNELHWYISTTANWIKLTQNVGIITPSSEKNIEFQINTSQLLFNQTYETVLVIQSNDQYFLERTIPVKIKILDQFSKITYNVPPFNLVDWSRGHCWGDFDNDGDLDLYIANGKPNDRANSYYKNNGDGTFILVYEGEFVTDSYKSMGCGCGDYDNDGDLDLFVVNADGQKNCLYTNNGDGTFKKVKEGEIANNGGSSNSCAWGDYDNDGFLDLFVANGFQNAEPNFLYHNNRDGSFSRITSGDIITDLAKSISCSWCDYDNDNDLDLFVVNYNSNNSLYNNDGDGNFTKITTGEIVNDGGNSIAASWGDVDNDGDMDLFVANWGERNFLYINNGKGSFDKTTKGVIVEDFSYKSSTESEKVLCCSFGDFDNDGDLDLIVLKHGNHAFYVNEGNGSFHKITQSSIITEKSEYFNSCSWCDYDNDGDLDLFTTSWKFAEKCQMYNNMGNENNWINIKCVGSANLTNNLSNISAIGTKIRIKSNRNGKGIWQMNEIVAQTGCHEQNSLNVEFGVGKASVIDSIKIEWPSGHKQVFKNIEVNQFITIYESSEQMSTDQFVRITTGDLGNDLGSSWGSAWGDFDNDDNPDLYVCNGNKEKCFLYKNNGDGGFSKIIEGNIVAEGSYNNSCTWGDYDNDGNLDLFVTVYATANSWERPNNKLYKNNGDGTFSQIAKGEIVNDGGKSYGCCWGDYDNDGFLDLFVANYWGENNLLYRNNKNGGFYKITTGSIVKDAGYSNCGTWADYDNDGDLDLFVVNSNGENNFLYKNNGNGNFLKITDSPISNDGGHSVSASWGDYDNDCDLDLFVTNAIENDFFYENLGDGNFNKIISGVIVEESGSSIGSSWIDFDNDGDLDLYVIRENGNSHLYENQGDRSFKKVNNSILTSSLGRVKGTSWADYNNDGNLDVFITRWERQNLLFRNTGKKNNWINILCIGSGHGGDKFANISAIGTKIKIKAFINGKSIWQFHEISSQTGMYAQNSLNVEFGLGDALEIDTLKVIWPSGIIQLFTNIDINQFIKIKESDGILSDLYQFQKISQGTIVNDKGHSRGCNWIDYDNDGNLDLFVANGWREKQKNFLYRNDQNSFTKISVGDIVNEESHSNSSTWGDYDNDGDIDLFLTNYEQPNNLFSNNGDGTFTKILYGDIVTKSSKALSCAWADYDNDSDLDLFICNELQKNCLYRNNGNGTFSNLEGDDIVNREDYSVCGAWGDYDNDGDLDIFIANYDQNNLLYQNNGDGTFFKIIQGDIVNDGGKSVGASWGDYNNDGFLDLFVTNFSEKNFLYKNNKNGNFIRIQTSPFDKDLGNSIGSSWIDFDNDGDLDLFVVNQMEKNFLYENQGDGAFKKNEQEIITMVEGNLNGCSWADYDNDGDLDVFITRQENEKNLLYQNKGNRNNWIKIQCIGAGSLLSKYSNVSAIGTKIRLKAKINGMPVWQTKEISSLSGYLGQNSLITEFGLGDAKIIDSIKVEWPSGKRQISEGIVPNQLITIFELGIIVPVELSTFMAKMERKSIILTWNTITELKTIGFEIERKIITELKSDHGWEKIGFIKGAGTSQNPNHYEFIDRFSDLIIGQYSYRLKIIDFDGSIEFSNEILIQISGPKDFELSQNYPNPFNPVTTLEYTIPKNCQIEIVIYDIVGRKIKTLLINEAKSGYHKIIWDGKDDNGHYVATGTYFCLMRAEDFKAVKKLILLK